MQKNKMRRTVMAMLFLSITLLGEIGIRDAVTVKAAEEKYIEDGHAGPSLRIRKTFGLVAENVRDVKIGQTEGMAMNGVSLYISQAKGEYRYINFKTKLDTEKEGLYYSNTLVTRNAKELIPISFYEWFIIDAKNQLRLTAEGNINAYKNLFGKKKQKGRHFEILASKEKVKYWADRDLFAFVKDNTLRLCTNAKRTEEKYFEGRANKIKKVVVGENWYHFDSKKNYNIFVLFKNGDVYGMGKNKYHLISDSDDKCYKEFTKINVSGVQDIVACERGVAAQKKDGSLWMWGERRTGKQHKTKEYSAKPYKIADQVEEFCLSGNGRHTCSILFLKNGTAYGWGSNKNYVMTSANEKTWHQKPVRLKSDTKHVYSADNMSFLLDQSGNLYWSGIWANMVRDFSWVEKKITGEK